MHEIAITTALMAVVGQEVLRCGGGRVVEIAISLGGLQSADPHAIRSCFDLLSEETDLDGAVLTIEKLPIDIYCNSCREDNVADNVFHCLECGGTDVRIKPSSGMIVKSITISR